MTAASNQSTSYRIIEAEYGKLRGQVAGGVASFKGVPYGDSTEGANRFLPPKPARPWSGVRDALELGPQSPQHNPDFPAWMDASEQGEDCLVLNVWAPDHAGDTSKLPVLVWLHGGAYAFGSAGAPFYDGANLARRGDVVVVGVNHRLHSFGYTYFGDKVDERFETSGNVGQLDLVEALSWIQRNIAVFGGNPQNVTIFGQSGGGMKVTTLMGMREAVGLFHKAAVISGSILHYQTAERAEALTAGLFKHLGLRVGDVESLQQAPAQAIVEYIKVWGDPAFSPTGKTHFLDYAPVLDGRVLTSQDWSNGIPKTASNIPTMIGTDLHETVSIIGLTPGEDAGYQVPEGALEMQPADDEEFARRLVPYIQTNNVVIDEVVPLIGRYRQAMPSLSQPELLVRITTDLGFWGSAVRQAQALVVNGSAPVYTYECRWRTPCFAGMWAPHGVVLPFMFNNQEYLSAWDGEDSEQQRAAADPDGVRFEVGDDVFEAFVNFARHGDPSTEERAWPAYDVSTRPTMVFDSTTEVINDNRVEVRPFITGLSTS